MRWEWLDSYFSGECTAEEARRIEWWIEAAPERRQRIEALRELWTRAAGRPDQRWNAQAAWQRLEPTLEVPAIEVRSRRRLAVIPGRAGGDAAPLRHPGMVYALRLAAALALVVGGATIWRLVVSEPRTMPQQVAGLREYVAPRGQRVSLLLADGTRIVLAPGSTLRAVRDIARAPRREVYLEGEALFEVVHNANRPFVVHAGHGTAEDLGTQFVVTAYPGDTTMRVVVAEGVVAVRGAPDSIAQAPQVLYAGDLATVNPAGLIVTAHNVAVREYLSWTTGQLVFRDVSVRDVVAVLARWYDVDIRIEPAAMAAAASHRVTLTTEPSQPLAEVLTALTLPVGLQARWGNGTIIIK